MDITTSPLIEMAEEAKRPTRWWIGWPVAFAIIAVGSAGGSLLGDAVLGSPESTETSAQYVEAFSFGVTLVALLLWVWLKEGRGFGSLGFRGSGWLAKLAGGLVIGAAMMGLGVLLVTIIGQYANGESDHTRLGASAVLWVIPLLLVVLLQSSTEEAITRGYILQIGGLQLPGWVAIVASSVLFAVIHLEFDPIVLLNITLYAMFACFVALGQGSLWLICGIHAGWNFAQGNLFGVPVSGNSYATSLFSFGPTDDANELLTGGDFGIEGSLMGTVVLALAFAVAYTYYRRQEGARTARPPLPQTA